MEMKTETQKAQEKSQLKDWFRKLVKDDFDRYDFEATFDSKLSYTENQTNFREQYKLHRKSLKEQVEQIKAEQERLITEEIKRAEAEATAYNQTLKYVENPDLDEFYRPIQRAVGKICQGFSNLAFIKGRGGIGKSRNIRLGLIRNKAEFVEVTGEVTEAYLYRLIYENNGKVIWLKDITRVLAGLGCLPEDTLVKTRRGDVKLIDLTGEDELLSWNFAESKAEFKRFERWNTGKKKLMRINTSEGVLLCSSEHKWLVKNEIEGIAERRAKDIKTQDKLLRLKQ